MHLHWIGYHSDYVRTSKLFVAIFLFGIYCFNIPFFNWKYVVLLTFLIVNK